MVIVRVSTTQEGHEGWVLELDVAQGTTVRALKALLAGPPHNLPVPASNKVLERRNGLLMGLPDEKLVKPEVALLGFVPAAPKLPAAPKSPVSPAAAAQGWARQKAPAPQREIAEVPPPPWLVNPMEGTRYFEQKAQAHRGQSPLERHFWSYARSIQFGVSMMNLSMRQVRVGTWERPRVIWVLNATDEVEVALARHECFREAMWLERCPTDLVLMGRDVDEFEMDAAPYYSEEHEDFAGVTPRVRTVQYKAVKKEAPPDVVVFFMPAMGVVRKDGTQPCAGHVEVPKEVYNAAWGAPFLITLRRNVPPSSLNKLSGKRMFVFTPLRCSFSGQADRDQAKFDHNGWVICAESQAANPEAIHEALKLDMLPEFQDVKQKDEEPEHKSPALFWGIIDLKYNPAMPFLERVKMLETGDGRTSRFSGAGAVCQKRYREKYRLEDGPGTGKSAVISANKKLTHDLMVQRQYEHLVPRQVCFDRVYTEDLAEKIMAGLEVGEDDVVVLKLANRTRAAGVLPVPVLDLDNMLRKVLRLPEDFGAWLAKEAAKEDAETVGIAYGCLEEQVRHWWSNECPFFVVERLATSIPTVSNWSGEEREYDGTMRIAFALHRKDKASMKGNSGNGMMSSGPQTMPLPEEIEVDWLGGYWKLPKEPTESYKLRESIISSAKTGTTYVETNQLLEVFALMGDSVQRLFGGAEPVAKTLENDYQDWPTTATYLVGRIGIAMRDLSSCKRTVENAAKLLVNAEEGPSKWCAQSFVSRGIGVVEGMIPPGRWAEALARFEHSIESCPANASSLYLCGQAHLELGDTRLAVDFMRKAMVLDLDFRAPYVNLGVAYLRLGEFDAAILVSEAGLKRHPESPQCNYHIALACYFKALGLENSSRGALDVKEKYDQIRARGLRELMEARDSEEAQRMQTRSRVEAPFLEEDDYVMDSLRPGNGFWGRKRDLKIKSHRPVQLSKSTGWRFIGWRT